MGRQAFVKNYNNLSGGVITDLNKLAGAPENAVRDALNFEFTASDGANRRKALDLESGIAGSDYVQLNSDLALGVAKQQVFTFKGILDALDTPSHDIVLNTFEGKGVVYDLGSDQQLADAVADASVTPSIAESKAWYDIAWSPKLELFVAVAGLVSGQGNIMISPDGERWTIPASHPSLQLSTVVWSPSLEIFIATSNFSVLTSSDGATWDENLGALGAAAYMNTTIWVEELALFISVGPSGKCYTSPDAWSWISRTIGAGRDWESVTWSPSLSLLVAVCSTGTATRVATSPDGITWTLRTTPATDRPWYGVTWSETLGKFYATGTSAGYIMSSADGLTWAEAATGISPGTTWHITWEEDISLLVAGGPYGAIYSSDGTSWTQSFYDAGGSNGMLRFAWSPDLSKFAGVDDSGSTRTMTSDDGITWSATHGVAELNENPADWIRLQGIPIGTLGFPELGILYNTDATTYQFTTTLGLGSTPLIRDFQGVADSLTVDENPAVLVFNVGSITGAFSLEDIEITDGSTTRRFSIIELPTAATLNVDKSIAIVSTTEFDGGDTTDYATWTVLGLTSGATATINTHSGVGLSDAHRYNLLNQGWTQTHMDTYAVSTDTWPSNAQTWYSGRDSSNNFSPTELDKIAFGNSESPRGHILLNPFKEWRHSKVGGVWSGSLSNVTYSRGFTTIAAFGSRVALSGANINGVENTVYISPVLIDNIVSADSAAISDLNFSELFTFYQKNDPTADIGNELLPDDGLVVPIAAANKIYKVVELQNAVLVFADNGVWAISGLDAQSGFQTDSFSVTKVTGAPGTTAPRSVVATSESVYYWAADGIYAIQYTPEGSFVAANITTNRIGELYKGIQPDVREAAISYYDEYNQKLYWAYNGETTPTYPEIRNKMLVLDLAINAYYPLKMPETLVDAGSQFGTLLMSINGFTQDPAYPNSDGTVPLKLFVTEIDNATATDFKHSVMEFNNAGTNFNDYDLWRTDVHADTSGTVDEEAYLQTWDDTLGDTSRSKQAIWVFTHMVKTEYGFEDLGGGALGALGVSSLNMTNRWDWHNSSAGGKWGTPREIYRHSRPYIPVDDTDTFDTGESVITTKNKVYGRGRALSLRFDAQPSKDAILLGFSIPYSVENTP